jgi:hypothetical protein
MALTIKKTGAKLGASLNVRSEHHGDESVGACDFKLSGVMLDKDDLNELYGDKYYHASLFNQKGKALDPMTRKNEPAQFKGKFDQSTVTLWLGLAGEPLKLSDVKLRKITLEPQVGGFTELCLQVQCNPDEEALAQLYTHQNMDVEVNIRFGQEEAPKQKAQDELPLDHQVDKPKVDKAREEAEAAFH